MNWSYSATNGMPNNPKSINHGMIIGQPYPISSIRKRSYVYVRKCYRRGINRYLRKATKSKTVFPTMVACPIDKSKNYIKYGQEQKQKFSSAHLQLFINLISFLGVTQNLKCSHFYKDKYPKYDKMNSKNALFKLF